MPRAPRLAPCLAPHQVSQHFFSLHLATVDDTLMVLQAMQRASVATDPNNAQARREVVLRPAQGSGEVTVTLVVVGYGVVEVK